MSAVDDVTTSPETWMDEGRCRELDPVIFFPTTGAGVLRAQAICARCPVKRPCLEYALANHIEHGVWGGESERSRRRIASQRRRERLAVTAG